MSDNLLWFLFLTSHLWPRRRAVRRAQNQNCAITSSVRGAPRITWLSAFAPRQLSRSCVAKISNPKDQLHGLDAPTRVQIDQCVSVDLHCIGVICVHRPDLISSSGTQQKRHRVKSVVNPKIGQSLRYVRRCIADPQNATGFNQRIEARVERSAVAGQSPVPARPPGGG